jgi:pilus assembly protein Flp/PilA
LTNQRRLAKSGRTEEENPMKKMINLSLQLKIWRDNHGQDLMEYALMAGFLAAASGYTLPSVASEIASVLGKVVAMLGGSGPDTAPGA